jgi:hypothetical protein
MEYFPAEQPEPNGLLRKDFPMLHQRNLLTAFGLAMLALSGSAATSLAAPEIKEFRLTINGQETQVDSGETINVRLANGKVLNIAIHQNETKKFSAPFFSFAHDRRVNVTSAKFGNGAVQYAMMSARGSVVLIQEIPRLDEGVSIEDYRGYMLNVLTKDDVELGATMSQTKARRRLSRGSTLKGIKATLSKGSDKTIYELQAADRGRRALLVATKIDGAAAAEDKKMIEDFWSTLDVKLR